jgi:hypothetical protein
VTSSEWFVAQELTTRRAPSSAPSSMQLFDAADVPRGVSTGVA